MEAFIKIYLYRTDLFNDPGDPGRLQGEDRQGPGAGDDPRGIHRRSPSSSPSTARSKGIDLWGTTAQAHTGHPASWYEFFESIAPTFGVYNWGIDADEQLRRLGRERRPDEQRQGQGRAEVLAAPARHRPAGIRRLDLDRGRRRPSPPAAPPRASSTARTPPGSRPTPSKSKVVGNVGVALPPLRARRPRGRRGRQGLHRLLRRRRLRPAGHLEEQGGGAALPAVHRPGLGAARLGRRRAAHHQHGDLRRPGGHRDGQEARRLLHDAARPGKALRRRAALSRSMRRCAKRPRRSSTRS